MKSASTWLMWLGVGFANPIPTHPRLALEPGPGFMGHGAISNNPIVFAVRSAVGVLTPRWELDFTTNKQGAI